MTKIQERKLQLFALNQSSNIVLDSVPVPSDVFNYAKKSIADKDRYGWFSEKEKNKYEVRCCSCQTSFIINYKPLHKSTMTCANCKIDIEIRKQWRSKDFGIYNNQKLCYLDSHKSAIVARYFMNNRWYSDNKYVRDVNKELREFRRIIFRPEGVRKFERNTWRDDPTWYTVNLIRQDYGYEMFQTKEELRNILGGTFLKNSPWLEFSGDDIFDLYKFTTWPALEYFLKLGYKTLVNEIINGRTAEDKTINLYRSKVNEVLGVPHSILQKYDHTTLRERDIKAIKQFIDYGRLGQLTIERFKFIQSVLTNDSLDPLEVFRTFGIEKVLNYIDKQVDTAEKINNNAGCLQGRKVISSKTVWKDFQDYRRECHELGYDITDEGIIFPRDMYAAHERTSGLVIQHREQIALNRSKEEAEKQAKKYLDAIKSYLKKEFTSDEYVIRIARTPSEIIEEGSKLKHCVGNYVSRVADKRCLIFVVRSTKAPNKPLYTLEVDYKEKNVIQCRGFQNKNAPAEVFQFVDRAFKQNFNREVV